MRTILTKTLALLTVLAILAAGTAVGAPGKGNGKGNEGKGKGHNDPTSAAAPYWFAYSGGNCTRYTDLTGAGPCVRGSGAGDRNGSILGRAAITSAGGSAFGYGAVVASQRLSPSGALNFTAYFDVNEALARVDAADTVGYAYARLDLSVYPPQCNSSTCRAYRSVVVVEEGITLGMAPREVRDATVRLNVTAPAASGDYRMYAIAYTFAATDTSFSTPGSVAGHTVPSVRATLPSVGGASATMDAQLTMISWAPQ